MPDDVTKGGEEKEKREEKGNLWKQGGGMRKWSETTEAERSL